MISKDKEAQILRLYHVEKWRVGTIAAQVKVHPGTVTRVLRDSGLSPETVIRRPSKVDPYLPFIREVLTKFPTLCASRVHQMVKARGYDGAEAHFRTIVARYRPRRQPEAFLRLRTLPGDQAQVDWGSFGTLKFGKAERKLYAFVMVLSYSRQIFLRFYLSSSMSSFLQGHRDAFEFFRGVPRVLLYDNLKSAVIERLSDTIRFNDTLIELASHYRFEPRPVNVARGNEKGRVERAIRYIRDNFFAAREFSGLEDLNQQAMEWMLGTCADRQCPEDRSITVRGAFVSEKPQLLALPDDVFPCEERSEVHSGKTPYVRFDLNDYSIPPKYVCQTLTVMASPQMVRITDGTRTIAVHCRCWDKGQQIEDSQHLRELEERKTAAREHRGMNRLFAASSHAQAFVALAASHRTNLGQLTYRLNQLLDHVSTADFDQAVKQALQAQTATLGAVRHQLDQIRSQRGLPPPVMWRLDDNPRAGQVMVRQHDLSSYDRIHLHQAEDDDLPF